MPTYSRPPRTNAEDLASQAAVFDFDSIVRGMVDRGLLRQQAILAAARKHPKLHQEFLLTTNPGRRQQRQLLEKFSEFET